MMACRGSFVPGRRRTIESPWLRCLGANRKCGSAIRPYDLEVLTPEYRPVDVTYTVLPFASPYNVPSDDTTKWHDVVTFSGSTVLVNAIPIMPIFKWARLNPATVSLGCVEHAADGPQTTAGSEPHRKRVFSVGAGRKGARQ